MATCGILADSLSQFTADVLRFNAAETRYFEYLGRGGGGQPHPPDESSQGSSSACNHSSSPFGAVNGDIGEPAGSNSNTGGLSALSQQIASAREQIASYLGKKNPNPKNSTSSSPSGGVAPSDDAEMREENLRLKKQLEELQGQVTLLTDRVSQLEGKLGGAGDATKSAPAPAKKPAADDGDDVDLFGSEDEEDDEAAKVREQRLAEYAAKKSSKPKLIAKSNVILDVKPWDDETDMKELEKCVRSIHMDGLLWGVSKLVPLAYGIQKLQITSVVEDEKVSIEELTEKLEEFEDFIQSVDIAAFNKI